eukprot:TRINITY_DN7905_c0_g1_i1.p1 TRINITY_DN7905_c0_g1~~TRINITY_DN7905_c0_g1_i1.p1  ORF type:complete len:351 (-),score=15.34 TRINITY_DN7905_c0_g1_i1:66-1118(-)
MDSPVCPEGAACPHASDYMHQSRSLHPCWDGTQCLLQSDVLHKARFLHDDEARLKVPKWPKAQCPNGTCMVKSEAHKLVYLHRCRHEVDCEQATDPDHCRRFRHLCVNGFNCPQSADRDHALYYDHASITLSRGRSKRYIPFRFSQSNIEILSQYFHAQQTRPSPQVSVRSPTTVVPTLAALNLSSPTSTLAKPRNAFAAASQCSHTFRRVQLGSDEFTAVCTMVCRDHRTYFIDSVERIESHETQLQAFRERLQRLGSSARVCVHYSDGCDLNTGPPDGFSVSAREVLERNGGREVILWELAVLTVEEPSLPNAGADTRYDPITHRIYTKMSGQIVPEYRLQLHLTDKS